MTFQERINSGKLYFCDEPGFLEAQEKRLEILYDFNATRPGEREKRKAILKEYFGAVGENLYVEPPLHASWGENTYWGNDCFANFNLTLVDDCEVRIGDNVLFAPNVVITTTGHAINPSLRKKTVQFSRSVVIGNNVWVGAGAIILPGVHIGDDSVIGAGSVVTKDIPSGVIAVGNPCRVLREIGEHDKKYYYKDMEVDLPIE